MQPLSNHLHVQPVIYKHTLEGIILPPAYQDQNNTGGTKLFRVLAVGPGRVTRKGVRIAIECEPGDHVLCASFTEGSTPMEDGSSIISDNYIIAVLPQIPVTQ